MQGDFTRIEFMTCCGLNIIELVTGISCVVLVGNDSKRVELWDKGSLIAAKLAFSWKSYKEKGVLCFQGNLGSVFTEPSIFWACIVLCEEVMWLLQELSS